MSCVAALLRLAVLTMAVLLTQCPKLRSTNDTSSPTTSPATMPSATMPPAVVVDPAILDFGEIPTGESSVKTLRLTNTGNKPARIVTHRGKTSLELPPNTVIAPGGSIEVAVQISGGVSPGPLSGKSVTIIVEGQPDISVPLTAKVISMVIQEPEVLSPQQNWDGRLKLCARDGQPFRIVAVSPLVIHGIADAPLREHEVTLDWPGVRRLAGLCKVVVYLDHPQCRCVVLKTDIPEEWSDEALQSLLEKSSRHKP